MRRQPTDPCPDAVPEVDASKHAEQRSALAAFGGQWRLRFISVRWMWLFARCWDRADSRRK
ncbi:MAG: hypothetical protein RMM31_11000 [Anaerolineae bacterium]|nr:hypothetical protein [Anaerolineae bacterium]